MGVVRGFISSSGFVNTNIFQGKCFHPDLLLFFFLSYLFLPLFNISFSPLSTHSFFIEAVGNCTLFVWVLKNNNNYYYYFSWCCSLCSLALSPLLKKKNPFFPPHTSFYHFITYAFNSFGFVFHMSPGVLPRDKRQWAKCTRKKMIEWMSEWMGGKKGGYIFRRRSTSQGRVVMPWNRKFGQQSHKQVYINKYLYTYIHIYAYMYMYVCSCMYLYAFICTHLLHT